MITEWRRVLRFGFTGGLNTGVDWLVFFLLATLAGVPAPLAQSAAYLAGTTNSWILNSLWVFGRQRDAKARAGSAGSPFAAPLRFLGVNALGAGLTAGTMHLIASAGLPLLPAKVIVTVLGMTLNYLLYRFWVFRMPPSA